jgi:hypothetical protein
VATHLRANRTVNKTTIRDKEVTLLKPSSTANKTTTRDRPVTDKTSRNMDNRPRNRATAASLNMASLSTELKGLLKPVDSSSE